MEFLQANWLWLLLGLGAVWFFLGRGGMGCGMGGHGSHGSQDSRPSKDAHDHGGGGKREADAATPRRHRGC